VYYLLPYCLESITYFFSEKDAAAAAAGGGEVLRQNERQVCANLKGSVFSTFEVSMCVLVAKTREK